MRVRAVITNWQDDCYNDDYEVGKNNVIEIKEFPPNNGNELHHFLIKYKDGSAIKAFNPNKVIYFKKS